MTKRHKLPAKGPKDSTPGTPDPAHAELDKAKVAIAEAARQLGQHWTSITAIQARPPGTIVTPEQIEMLRMQVEAVLTVLSDKWTIARPDATPPVVPDTGQ